MIRRLEAALIFFTRLPFWRVWNPPQEAYSRVVELWPYAGWITGGIAAFVCWGASLLFAPWVAVVFALGARVLATGALHEDGLADFFDGFGGGSTREATLRIMKDSHIGTYGVLGLLLYFLLGAGVLASLPPILAVAVIAVSDPLGKCVAAQVINVLPYARTAEQAKNRTVYQRMSPVASGICALGGVLPLLLFLKPPYWWGALGAAVVGGVLMALMHRRLRGYTGDCCGALFLLSELAMWISITGIYSWMHR